MNFDERRARMSADELRTIARQRYGRVTPYRLGLLAGEFRLVDFANPYRIPSRGGKLFEEGAAFARKNRRDHAAALGDEGKE